MRHFCPVALVIVSLLPLPVAWADAEYEALHDAYEQAEKDWRERPHMPDSGPDLAKHPAIEFMPKFRQYAEKRARKSDAIGALGWMIRNCRESAISDREKQKAAATWAFQRLAKDHATDPSISSSFYALRFADNEVGRDPLVAFYETVIKVNKQSGAKAAATFNLACLLYQHPAERAERGPTENRLSPDQRRALSLFQSLVRNYPDSDVTRQAGGYIYELEHLQVGMKAPDLTGADADNKSIKLSQFRGKVVVAYFWGFW